MTITSTEGEVMRATLAHVDQDHGDVVVDITETNQPERYEKLGRQIKSCSWVIPWEYIADIKLAE